MSNAIVPWINLPELPAITGKAELALSQAEAFVIETDELCEMAERDFTACKGMIKALDEERKEFKRPLVEAAAAVDEHFNVAIGWLRKGAGIWEPKILAYRRAQAAQKAEAQRIANEQAEAARKALEKQAAKLEKGGDTETASIVRESASLVTAPAIAVPVASSDRGANTRVTWSAEVFDLMALVKAVAAGTVPLAAIEANTSYLNKRAQLEHEALSIPGVKSHGTESLAAKRGRAA